MRLAIVVAAVSALVVAGGARAAPQSKPAAKQEPAAAPQPLPGMFPCRTEAEICFIGIVTSKNEILVQFTNASETEGIDEKPVAVFSGDAGASPLDLSQDLGRVVMLTGGYAAGKGIGKAAVVDVASPILSFLIKSQLSAGDDQPPPAGGNAPPQKKR